MAYDTGSGPPGVMLTAPFTLSLHDNACLWRQSANSKFVVKEMGRFGLQFLCVMAISICGNGTPPTGISLWKSTFFPCGFEAVFGQVALRNKPIERGLSVSGFQRRAGWRHVVPKADLFQGLIRGWLRYGLAYYV